MVGSSTARSRRAVVVMSLVATAIARRVGSGSRVGPLVQPGGEDRVGIALDRHAGRASVVSTWLSATIAARRVRVA